MRDIRMVDLQGQTSRIRQEVDEALRMVIDGGQFVRGTEIRAFEEELAAYLRVPHAVTCGNGTDALQVALMALDLEPGDEVITPPFTFVATVEVIRLLGLKPVFVDVREDTFNLDPALLEAAAGERTRALVPVHLFGQCADMDPIMEFALGAGIHVIEDNAQAIGAEYTHADGRKSRAGTIGHLGTTSFFPSKNLGAFGDGGAVFTRDEGFASALRSLVNHGMGGERYHYDSVGVNSRLDTLQAAVLRVKLKYLEEYHEARRKVAAWYERELFGIDGLTLPVRSGFSTHVFHQYTVRVPPERRSGLQAALREAGIPSAIYYPVPIHRQPAYLDLDYAPGSLPVTEALSREVLSLPIHTEMDEEQLSFITDRIRDCFDGTTGRPEAHAARKE